MDGKTRMIPMVKNPPLVSECSVESSVNNHGEPTKIYKSLDGEVVYIETDPTYQKNRLFKMMQQPVKTENLMRADDIRQVSTERAKKILLRATTGGNKNCNFCDFQIVQKKSKCPCGLVAYCSKDCQKKDWKTHKTEHN